MQVESQYCTFALVRTSDDLLQRTRYCDSIFSKSHSCPQYFPKTTATWVLYCLTTGLMVALVKVLNLALHLMYDEAQIVSENHLKQSGSTGGGSGGLKTLREQADADGCGGGDGIEMQVLNSGGIGGASQSADGLATSVADGDADVGGKAGDGSALGLSSLAVAATGGGDANNTHHSNNISQANSSMSIECAEHQQQVLGEYLYCLMYSS